MASLLLDPPSSGARVIELSGPEDYSVGDVAAAISRAGNKPVAAVEVPVTGPGRGLREDGRVAQPRVALRRDGRGHALGPGHLRGREREARARDHAHSTL
ncbi:MAG: hypothetical protein R3A52_10350 [Polyangiales bacterium]